MYNVVAMVAVSVLCLNLNGEWMKANAVRMCTEDCIMLCTNKCAMNMSLVWFLVNSCFLRFDCEFAILEVNATTTAYNRNMSHNLGTP